MIQKGDSVLWKASFEGHTEIVLLLLYHHAAVDLPTEVRHSNTMYTVDIDACTCYSYSEVRHSNAMYTVDIDACT